MDCMAANWRQGEDMHEYIVYLYHDGMQLT